MKKAISQEPMSDSSHSCIPAVGEGNLSSSNRVKSAAMLGIALSVGASGAFVSQADAAAAVSAPVSPSAPTEAFSSDSKVSATTAAETAAATATPLPIAGYHTVASGESLWQIAQQYHVGLRDLKTANALAPETSIRVGQVLRVPDSEVASRQTVAPAQTQSAQLIAGITADEQPLQVSDQRSPAQLSSESVAPVADSAAASSQASAKATSDAAMPGAVTPSVTTEVTASAAGVPTIEMANASSQDVAATSVPPIVTARLASPTFSQYQVQPGDTLGSIAAGLDTTSSELIRANGLNNPNVIMAGATLVVPTETATTEAATTETATTASNVVSEAAPSSLKKVETPTDTADSSQQSHRDQRLAHLRSTATAPDSAGLLENLRSASPEEAASVGGELSTEADLLATDRSGTATVDPYVANLLEEVQEIRVQSVATSEAETTEIAAPQPSIAPTAATATEAARELSSPRVALAPSTTSTEANADLLAAAPLSPDAYIPAQRSSAGQVVSPDMPILPAEGEYLPEAPNYFNGYIWPTQGTVTSGYGWRWGRMHRGVDVAGPVGTPVVAAGSGVVEQAGWNSGGYGNMVEIRHPDGSMTRYAHNNRLNVSTGQSVRQGQQIAEMGSTGYSTGPHLHFEVHPNGQGAVNPVAYLPDR